MSEWIKNKPYVAEDGIHTPCNEYSQSGTGSMYKLAIPRDIFIEAYEKFCKSVSLPSRDEYFKKSINKSPALYKCPKCGGNVRRDNSCCLTTYPPQYRYTCDDCDYYEMI